MNGCHCYHHWSHYDGSGDTYVITTDCRSATTHWRFATATGPDWTVAMAVSKDNMTTIATEQDEWKWQWWLDTKL